MYIRFQKKLRNHIERSRFEDENYLSENVQRSSLTHSWSFWNLFRNPIDVIRIPAVGSKALNTWRWTYWSENVPRSSLTHSESFWNLFWSPIDIIRIPAVCSKAPHTYVLFWTSFGNLETQSEVFEINRTECLYGYKVVKLTWVKSTVTSRFDSKIAK